MNRHELRRWILNLGCLVSILLLTGFGGVSTNTAGARSDVRAAALAPEDAEAIAQSHGLYHPSVLKGFVGYDSTLYIQNAGSIAANSHIEFIDVATNQIDYATDVVIPASGSTIVAASEIAMLDPGEYGVVVSSTESLVSVVDTFHTEYGLGSYRGISPPSADTQYLGPYYKTDNLVSNILLWHVGAVEATYEIDFFDLNGTLQHRAIGELAPGAQLTLHSNALPVADGTMWAVVTADQPLLALMNTFGNPHQSLTSTSGFRMQNALAGYATTAYVPRAFKNVDEGSGPRSTSVFIGNTSNAAVNVTLSFYDPSGQLAATEQMSQIAAYGGWIVDLQALSTLGDGSYSVIIEGTGAIAVSESTYHTGERTAATASYTGVPYTALTTRAQAVVAYRVYLPRTAGTDSAQTPLSVMNLGSSGAMVQVTYYGSGGSYSHVLSPAPGAAVRVSPDSLGLPADFEGSAVVAADQPVSVLVDEYRIPPCSPPQSAQIDRAPTGALTPDMTAYFTATVQQGTAPFAYTWAFGDGATAVGGTTAHAFSTPGTYTTTLTVANACGETTATERVEVVALLPDLSSSQKIPSRLNVGPGDILTYTLVLRNRTEASASATVIDPIPTHTTYISDSVSANLGSAWLKDDEIWWHGGVVAGAPVTVRFAVRVAESDLTAGDTITNAARLGDGEGAWYTLTAPVTYNPGYSVTIEDGALYTNQDVVDLDMTWNANDDVTQMRISNDGGFTTGTGWLSVASSYSGWTLATMGDSTLPRTVYVQFRDSEGNPTATIQDDILYDPVQPEIVSVEVLSVTRTLAVAHVDTPVIVRVTVSDTLSGPAMLSLSDDSVFSEAVNYPVTGLTTDINWSLQPSGKVYVRAADAAGNLSDIVDEKGAPLSFVYLPMATRQ